MTAALHHSASADDFLLLRHTTHSNKQDGDVYDVSDDSATQQPHSDDELDEDTSSITVRPESPPVLTTSTTTTTTSTTPPPSPPVEIAFSASAGAFVYQMGVAAYIQDHFDLSNCHLSGCSGGSWAATLLAAETNVHTAWKVIQKTQNRIVPENAAWYTGYGRYARIVAETIQDLWQNDPDVHLRVQKKNLSIAVTKFPSMKPERHTAWSDLDDLMKSILASAMIPFALSGKPCISHRGQWYVDGGITNFKGVNCDQYSTWSDIYYHSLQLTVDAVRSTTTAVAERFFPSLTKPVAKLINGLLPQIASPHDAIAPRLIKNSSLGSENPQCGSSSSAADVTDTSRPRILLKPWTWRSHHITAFHLSVDIASHQQRFDFGYDDARVHHHELAALLPPKQPSQSV